MQAGAFYLIKTGVEMGEVQRVGGTQVVAMGAGAGFFPLHFPVSKAISPFAE